MTHAKRAADTAKCAVPTAKYAVLNKVIPKLSPELSPKRCYAMQTVQCQLQTVQCQLQNVQCHMQNVQHPMQNMQYKIKLSPSYPQSYPQKGVIPLQNVQYTMQNMQHQLQDTQYPMQNTQHNLQNMQQPLQNTQYKTKLSPSYPQSYPQWICHRKMDLKNKSKCFILT